MSVFEKLRHHAPRVGHSLGRPLKLGNQQYRLRGFHPDRLARGFTDEPHMLPVLKRVFKDRRGAFIDVGANCGQTLIKVLATDPHRNYFGFEPQLECCFYIEQFLRLNSIHHASIVPVALSNTNRLMKLSWSQPNDLTASILPSHPSVGEPRPHSSWVPTRRGDELVQELGVGEIAVIKIDVEGFELEVLTGLSDTLSTQKPIILFEVLTNYFWDRLIDDEGVRNENQTRADAIFTLLSAHNYIISQIDGAGAEHRINHFNLNEKSSPPFVNDGRDYIARPF